MGKRYKTSETTCQAISGALKQLMIQKPLERITVAEIMDTCGMRRQYFYYYFTDIYDLLRWTFEKEALELLQQQQSVSPWQNGFLHLFQYINQNRAVCLCALDSLGKESLKRLLEADVSSIVDRAVRQAAVECAEPPLGEDRPHLLHQHKKGGRLDAAARGELTQTPEEVTRRIDMMFQDYIRGVALRLKAPAAVYA